MTWMRRTLLILVKWWLTTTGALLILGCVIVGAAFLASYHTGHWHWFQRSGALVVSIGAILSTRRMLRVGLDGLLAGGSYFDVVGRLNSVTGDGRDPETRRDLIAAYWGFGTVGFGTLLWAFGDLTGCLVAGSLDCLL